jgi:hypothetical protein
MGSDKSEAWFEADSPEVDGFDKADCPHGQMLFVFEHSRTDRTYKCARCGQEMIAKIIEE